MTKKTKKKTKKKIQTKKPKWTLVTYKGIEKARTQLGFTKSAMAEALEVTNSTYHNWRRGTTVPHPNQQEQIKDRLRMLSGDTAITTTRTSSSTRRAASAGSTKRGGTAVMDPPVRGTAPRAGGVSNGGNTLNPDPFSASAELTPASLSAIGDVPRLNAIGTITAAWLASQKKAASAGSTLKFVRDLDKALARGT